MPDNDLLPGESWEKIPEAFRWTAPDMSSSAPVPTVNPLIGSLSYIPSAVTRDAIVRAGMDALNGQLKKEHLYTDGLPTTREKQTFARIYHDSYCPMHMEAVVKKALDDYANHMGRLPVDECTSGLTPERLRMNSMSALLLPHRMTEESRDPETGARVKRHSYLGIPITLDSDLQFGVIRVFNGKVWREP